MYTHAKLTRCLTKSNCMYTLSLYTPTHVTLLDAYGDMDHQGQAAYYTHVYILLIFILTCTSNIIIYYVHPHYVTRCLR